MKTLAEHAADEMNEKPDYGPNGIWAFDAGHLDFQHAVYDRWTFERGLPLNNGLRPWRVLHSVREACARTKSGRRLFRRVKTVNYPGIMPPCTRFELREEFRSQTTIPFKNT